VKAAVELHQFAEVRLARPALVVRHPLALPRPEALLDHEPPQRLRRHLDLVFLP